MKKYIKIVLVVGIVLLTAIAFFSLKKSTPISPEIADWKRFESKELGLMLQYPSDWNANTSHNGAGEASISLFSPHEWEPGDNKRTIEPGMARVLVSVTDAYFSQIDTNVEVSGYPTKKTISEDLILLDSDVQYQNIRIYEILKDNKVYQFYFMTPTQSKTEQYNEFVDIFEKIVHNARF